MARGRKPIPSKIVELYGGADHTHRPPRDDEPKPPAKMPKCPKHLDKFAQKEWRRASKILAPLGLLTEIDMMIFAAYCEAYSRWVQSTLAVQKGGMVYKKEDGTPGLNPYLKVAREAYDQMIKAGTEIGMSPSSRASLKVHPPKQRSKAEKFKDRKNAAQN